MAFRGYGPLPFFQWKVKVYVGIPDPKHGGHNPGGHWHDGREPEKAKTAGALTNSEDLRETCPNTFLHRHRLSFYGRIPDTLLWWEDGGVFFMGVGST